MTKPNFTGTWKFNSRTSKLKISSPNEAMFVINYCEPFFHFTRTTIVHRKVDRSLEYRINLSKSRIS